MAELMWVGLTESELKVVNDALNALKINVPDRTDDIERLSKRLEANGSTPSITIGVYGGMVQWVEGNPFPIRIIDYDGDKDDLPDTDDEGQPCSIWSEPADTLVMTVA